VEKDILKAVKTIIHHPKYTLKPISNKKLGIHRIFLFFLGRNFPRLARTKMVLYHDVCSEYGIAIKEGFMTENYSYLQREFFD
jgi:hypothetical protein